MMGYERIIVFLDNEIKSSRRYRDDDTEGVEQIKNIFIKYYEKIKNRRGLVEDYLEGAFDIFHGLKWYEKNKTPNTINPIPLSQRVDEAKEKLKELMAKIDIDLEVFKRHNI